MRAHTSVRTLNPPSSLFRSAVLHDLQAVERAQCAPSGDRHRQLLGWELKRLLGFTDARKGYHATFLHDAKVYFAAACFDRLVAMGVLAERQLSILASPDAVELVITAASDAAHRGTHVTDVVVAPGRALDFTREFARWLEDQNRRSPPVDTVVTDLGCGHNGREGNWLVAQDCDDAAALLLAGPIRRLFVCDETPLLSRAAAALAHFGHQVSGGIVSGQATVHTHQVHPDAEATCKMLTSRVRIALAKNDGAGAAVLNGAFEAVAELRPHPSAAFDAIAAAERALRHLSAPPPTATLQLACRVCGEINAAETEAVSRQCFVPTLVQLDALIAQSVLAEADLAAGRRTKLVSKLPHVAPLCPPTLDPGDTILVKLGRAHGRIGDGTYRAIPDQALVYWTSFGSNSVYLEPDNDTRINLVYRSRAAIADMLDAYFAVRAAWLPAIIKMIPDKIRECKLESGGYAKHFPYKFDADGNVDTVPDVWWPAFDAVADMLDAVGVRLRWALWHAGPDAVPAVVLRQCLGLELISLCQTWMRGSGVIGDAEFSVMSPHFQNRLVVVDAEKLMSCCGVTASHLEAYSTLGKQFAANMEAAQYSGPKGAAFMHLDKLRLLL